LFEIVACSPNKNKVETMILSLDTTFSELSDSSFIPTRVMCMNVNNEDIYFSDYSGGIVVLDKSFNVKEKIGKRGEGPAEFLGAAHFYVEKEDSIYVLNEGKHAIELFVKGKHLKQIRYPKQASLTNCTRFFSENQLIFHSIISDSLSTIVFDNNSHICRFIGKYTDWDDPDLRLHSTRHVLKGDQSFFIIGCTLPVFQIYSFDGKLITEYDLKEIPEINTVVKKYNMRAQTNTTYFTMIQDVYYDNHKIYLLVANNKDGYVCNEICILEVEKDIKHIATL
jgi:hypothetical protein